MGIPQPLNLFVPSPTNYIPQAMIITAMTNAVNSAVTTANPHGYQTGMSVRITVPKQYGMVLSYVQTQIIVTGSTTFTTQINTTALQSFVVPSYSPANPGTLAQCVPINGLEWNIAPLTGITPPPIPPLPPPPPNFSAPLYEAPKPQG